MRETPFKRKVECLLDNYNAWYIKYWAGSRYTRDGIPDILACINGEFYGVELKGDGGKPSLLQLKTLEMIREAKGVGVLLYPEDLKYFEELINGTEMGKYWYRENRQKQQKLFNEFIKKGLQK